MNKTLKILIALFIILWMFGLIRYNEQRKELLKSQNQEVSCQEPSYINNCYILSTEK